MIESIVWVVDMLAAVAIIGLVLLQHGKGADMGAAFGSGSAGGLFGSRGAANFLSRGTAVLAAVFFVSSLVLTWYSGVSDSGNSVMQPGAVAPVVPAPMAPVAPVQSGRSSEIPK